MTERMVSGCMSIMTCRLAEFNRPHSYLHNQPSDIHWKDARKPAARPWQPRLGREAAARGRQICRCVGMIGLNGPARRRKPGPKTPDGKMAVRLNGLRHGFSSREVVRPGENEAA